MSTTIEKRPMRTIRRSPVRGKLASRDVVAVLKALHVVPDDGRWLVMRPSKPRVRKRFASKEEAIGFARSLAQRIPTKVFVYDPSKQSRAAAISEARHA